MSDTNLSATIQEVISGKPKTDNKSGSVNTDGVSQEKKPEYVFGVDISDMPEENKKIAREVLEQKGGLLEKGYQPKFQEVANRRKLKEELEGLQLSPEEVLTVLNTHIENKKKPVTPQQTKTEAQKTLDEIIKSVPINERPALEQLRKVIKEESDTEKIDELSSKIKQMEAVIGDLKGTTQEVKLTKAESEVSALNDKYGSELIDKYKKQLIDAKMQYPNLPTNKVATLVIPDEEWEEALLKSKTKRQPIPEEKRNAITNASSGMSGGSNTVDLKQFKNTSALLRFVAKNKK